MKTFDKTIAACGIKAACIFMLFAAFLPGKAAAQQCAGAPRDVTFTAGAGAGTASISWSPPTITGNPSQCPIGGYFVQMRVMGGAAWPSDAAQNVFPSGATATSVGGGLSTIFGSNGIFTAASRGAEISGLTVGTIYQMHVSAHNSERGGPGPWSALQTLTVVEPPAVAAPTALTATAKSGTADTVTLTWTNSPTANAAHYVRWRRGASGAWASLDGENDRDCNALVPASCGGDQTAGNGGLEIPRLWINTAYEFEVVAVVGGDATASGVAMATTNDTTATLNAIRATNIPTIETGFAADSSQTFLTRTVASSVATTRILVASDAIAAINQLGSGATEAAARSAAAATTGAALSVDLDVTLTADATTYVAIIVTLSGVTQTYILAITRRSNTDATLLGVTIAGVEGSTDVNPVLHPAFDSEITQYGISVDRHATASTLYTMTFTPTLLGGTTAAGSAATATAGGFAFPSMNNPNNYIFMMNGEALGAIEYILTVTAADGNTTKAYHFHIIVGPDVSEITLADATAGGSGADIPLTPAFNRNQVNYTAGTNGARTEVPLEVEQVLFKAKWTADGPNSGVGIRDETAIAGVVDKTGAAGKTIPLSPGKNIIDLVFTKTGASKTDVTYSITIIREVPPAPAAVKPSSGGAGETRLVVNWTQVDTATGYHLRWRVADVSPVAWLPDADGEDAGDVATHTITGLTPKTSYIYQLRAANAGGNSAWTEADAAVTTISAEPVMFTTTAGTSGEQGAGAITITAQIAAAPAGNQNITFTTGGTATLADDYTISASPIQIMAGETTATISVAVVNDTAAEAEEMLTITLTDGGGYSLAASDTVYTLTITDDDLPAKITALGGQPNTGSNTAILIAWEEPDSQLGSMAYDIRYRVKAPLTRWEIASDVTDTNSGYCTNFSITAPCRQATLGSLAAGVTYQFQVRGEGSAGAGPWSDANEQANSGTANNTTAEPASITATATVNGATVEWTAPASHGTINDYRIHYRTAAVAADAQANPPVVAVDAGDWMGWIDAADLDDSPIIGVDSTDHGFGADSTTPTTVTLSGLMGGVTYDVGVAVVVGRVRGPWVSTTVTPTAPQVAPEALAAPTASMVTSTGFTVNWVKDTAATNYHVRWRTAATTSPVVAAGAWQNAMGDDADCTSDAITTNCGEDVGDVAAYAIASLAPTTLYDFAVRAGNAQGSSGWASGTAQSTHPTVDFTTTSGTAAEGGSVTVTAELSAAVATATTITLSTGGTAASNDYTLSPSPFIIAANETTADLTITAADDAIGENDETLTVTIAAGTGYDPAATDIEYTLTITDDDAPAKTTATGSGAGGMNDFIWAIWDIPAGMLGADPYEIRYRVKSPLGEWTRKEGAALTVTAAGASCTGALASDCVQAKIEGLAGPGVTYEFQVRARNTAGAGEWSDLQEQANSGAAANAPAAPTALTATAGGAGIALAWTPPAGTLNDYRIRYRTAATTNPTVAAGTWQGWIDAADITDSPVIGDDTSGNGFSIAQNTAGYTLAGLTSGTEFDIGVAAVAGEVIGAFADTTATPLITATLSSLDVSQFTLAPTFDAATLSYALTVPFATTAVTITAATQIAAAATITVGDIAATAATTVTVRITDGDQIEVRVAATDFAAQTYIIGVTIEARKKGDANADGEIDINDGILIARYLLGIRGGDLIDGINTAGADAATIAEIEARIKTEADAGSFNVDKDTAGETTAADAVLIARYLLGVESGAGLTGGQVQVNAQGETAIIDNIKKLINDAASP